MDIKDETQANINGIRRKLLLWTPPIVTAVALPAHAEGSVCRTPPIAVGVVPAKCEENATDPNVLDGVATISIFSSDAAIPVEILSVTNDAVAPNVITGPTSGTVTAATTDPAVAGDGGLDLKWEGPSTDASTCLPEVDVNFTVTYTCENDPGSQTYTFTLVELLSPIVP